MIRKITQSIVLGLLLLGGPFCAQHGVYSPVTGIAHADDSDNGGDDSSNDNGGGTLSPDLQWALVSRAWDKREYDDAAVLGLSFAEANPDHPNALDALWRAYIVYHDYRPNADKSKDAAGKLSAAASKWLTKYQGSDKERGGTALFYTAYLYSHEGQTDAAIATFQQLVKKFPGTGHEPEAWWDAGEWLNGEKRWDEAIAMYEGYRKCVGPTDQAAGAVFREAQCYENLKDKANAIETYKIVFDPKYAWNGGWIGPGAIDAARHLIVDGAPDVSRKMAMMVVDKSPTEGWQWPDIQNQAKALLGEAPAKNLFMQPYLINHYSTSHVNIEGGTKLTLSRESRFLISVRYASATDPVHAVLTFAPKVDMKTIPTQVTKVDGDKPTYTMAVDSPDAKGNLFGDQNMDWVESDQEADPPSSLVLTRKWEKEGSDWGTCTIRIQSSDRWHMWIYLPNNKTNANNVNIQPNEVNDNGATFRYYNWYDQTQGMTITFPITVGPQVSEYYPKIHLQFDSGRGPDLSTASTDAKDNLDEYTVDFKSDKPLPATYNHPVQDLVDMDEISK